MFLLKFPKLYLTVEEKLVTSSDEVLNVYIKIYKKIILQTGRVKGRK